MYNCITILKKNYIFLIYRRFIQHERTWTFSRSWSLCTRTWTRIRCFWWVVIVQVNIFLFIFYLFSQNYMLIHSFWRFINTNALECLNESAPGTAINCFKPYDLRHSTDKVINYHYFILIFLLTFHFSFLKVMKMMNN